MTTTTMTQTDYPFGEQGSDIPEYISIYDKPIRPRGRPKQAIQLTDDDKIQRMRTLASKHYYENIMRPHPKFILLISLIIEKGLTF